MAGVYRGFLGWTSWRLGGGGGRLATGKMRILLVDGYNCMQRLFLTKLLLWFCYFWYGRCGGVELGCGVEGLGCKKVHILRRIDDYAKTRHLSRSGFLAHAAETALRKEAAG
ncbi:MAG: type II toxin-antitoxin system HicB family antitoxin [Magnetococcus sp. YQC-9]